MTTPTAKNPNDAFAYLTNESGAKSELVRIAALVDLQVGTPDTPAELHVTGRFSQSVVLVQAQANQTLNFPANFTLLCVEVVNPKENSQIYVNLPDSPRLGQLCYVKDESGTSDICNLVVQSNSKINSSNNTIIDFKNGCIGFTWLGESWTIITSSGSSTIIEKTIVQEKTTETIISSGGGGGSGDVVGPSSSTDNAVVRFDLTTGKLIQNSGVTISDANNVVIPGSLSIAGGYGSSGVTISTAGNVQANGNATFDGSLTVTGGTTSVTDAILGNAAVGSFPYFDGGAYSGDYAIFSHKDLDNSSVITNYAIYQDKIGNTSINAADGKNLYFAINNVAMGAITNDLLGTGIDSIVLTGDLSTRTNVLLGNSTGASSTTINAGTGDITLAGNTSGTDVVLEGYVRIPSNPTLFIDTITPAQSLTSATTNINWSNTAPNFFDNSSGWDNTNKNWTVPKTGRYQVSISLLSRISSSISADVRYIQCTMYNSGTTNRYTVAEGGAIDSAAYSGVSPINYYQSIAGSGVYALTSSHKVAFQFSSNANNSSVFLYNGSSEQKLYIKYLGLD